MSRVFISYRRSGTAATANHLHTVLQQHPLYLNRSEIFLDTVSIPPGKKFRGHVQEAIARTEAFLVIIDDEWLNKKTSAGLRLIEQEKDNCRLELHQALIRVRSAEAIELLPIIEGSLPHPKREDFPEQLGEIIEFNSLRWDHDNYEPCVEKVVAWVSDSLGLNRDDVERRRTSSWGSPVSVGLPTETEPVVDLAVVEPPVPPATQIDSQQADAAANELLLAIRRSSRNQILEYRGRLERWDKDHCDDADQSLRCKVLTLLAETEFHLVAAAHEDGEPFETQQIREGIERAEATRNVLVDGDTQDRLLCLRARVDFIDGRKSDALESLGTRTTPLPFKFRLIMLQELGRLKEANELLDGKHPSPRWTDVAIPIRFMSGHDDQARELLAWTIINGDEIAAHHCRLAMARCLHTKALERFKDTGKISSANLTHQELKGLGEAREPLDALIGPAIARGWPENGLEIDGLEIAVQIAHLRLDRETACFLAKVLALARPASNQAAQAFLWGYLPYSPELVANLRADRPRSFDANFLATTMEFDSRVVPENLVEKINDLWSLAKETDDKERLAGFLIHFVPELPKALKASVIKPLEQSLGTEHDIVLLLNARESFLAGNIDDAKRIVETRKTTNPEWEILLADIAESQKDDASALRYLMKAAESITHPDLFWRAAIAASRTGDWPKTIELLELVLRLAPKRLKARRQLFQAYMRDGSEPNMRLAQEQLKVLANAEPNILEHVLNQAIVCTHLKEFPAAISILDELLQRSSPQNVEDTRVRLSATLLKARLVSAENPAEAFSLLNSDAVRAEFTEQIAFWQGYMLYAHRAGQDGAAHEAREQILRLEEGLSDDQKSLWPVEFEELKEMLLARGTFLRELRRMVASSRCTISFLAMEENRPLVQEMIHRTQPMNVPETEEHHGRFVTYASNGIVFSPGRSGFYETQDLKCAPPDSSIVIDPTSIVTLHRLGLLQAALARFSHVRVPAHLISKFINVVEKLEPHQRSSREATMEAERLLIAGKIATDNGSVSAWIVEFDGESGSESVGIRHVIDWLNQKGHLGEDAYKQLQALHFDGSGNVEQLTAAIAAGPVGATTQALTTLARHQLLETFVARATIVVSEETRQEIFQAAKFYRDFEGMRLEYERMIQQLRAAPNVVFDGFNALAPDGDSRENEINRRLEEAALSVRLAKDHAENLLVDDRVCQQMLAHERGAVPLTTFSCWHLVEALYDEKKITMLQLATACVKLMQWRYRFFIPRADVLLYFAHQYRASCPGQRLRDVAAYMMDCFADSGLPCGLEPTSPPFTLSARLFHRWMTVAVDFIVGVWISRGFSLVQKKQFVSWALTNVAPMPAAHAATQEQTGLAHVGRQLILSSILLRLPVRPTGDCPSAVLLQVIRETLAISELEYFRTLGTTLSNLLSDLDDADDAKKRGLAAFLQRMAEHAVGADDGSGGAEFHVSHLGIGLMMSVGYLDGREPDIPCEFSAEQLAAIASKLHILHKTDHGNGPLCFVWKSVDKESVETVDVATRLGHALGTVREAACDYFKALSWHAGSLLSEYSNKLFLELEPRIRSSDAALWYPAATAAIDTFERDFLLNLAGFAQSLPLPADLQRVRNTFANRVFNPPDHPAKHVSRENFDDLASAEVWLQRVESCVVADDLQQSIRNYLQRFRHLPLDGEYSMAAMVHRNFSAAFAFSGLLELAESKHPLDQFQGCKALCQLWLELSPQQKTETVAAITRFLSQMFDEPTTVEGHLWQCRRLLVRHYLYQCELYEPGWPPDTITALAWKLADMVMEVITPHANTYAEPIPYIQRICEEVILPMTLRRELVARLVRRPCPQSVYRLASLDDTFGSPFGFGLLCEIEPAIPQLLKSDLANSVLTRAVIKMILANGPFLPAPQSVLFRSTSDQWSHLVETWLQNDKAPDREALSECVKQYKEFIDPERLTEAILILPEADKPTRLAILYQMDRLAILDHLPHDPLWKAMSDEAYQKSMLASFDLLDLKLAINSIVTVQQSQAPEWSWQLPYAFLHALKLTTTAELAEVFVAGLLASTGRRQAYSVLSRINAAEFSPVVVDKLRFYVDAIQRPEKALPSYARLHIRQIVTRTTR